MIQWIDGFLVAVSVVLTNMVSIKFKLKILNYAIVYFCRSGKAYP